ncbi:MAG TPA: hypothetical protein VF294_04335, partial [Polyangiaceae bacterium]
MAFELGDVVVDVAGDRGATTGATLELWRPLNIKHPVTGQMVSDRFLIGRLRLVQVRGALSLALPDGKLAQPAQPGDIVVLHRPSAARAAAKPSLTDTASATATATTEPPSTSPAIAPSLAPEASKTSTTPVEPGSGDAEAAEVSAIFEQLRGASVRRRVLAYEAYVTHRPHGKYAVVLYEEAAHLRRLVEYESGDAKSASDKHESALRNFEPPREARSHTPLRIAVELSNAPVAAVIPSRNSGEVAYHTAPMSRVGDGYFSATIEAERLNAPRLEYFIEGVASDGRPMFVLGSA